MAPSYANIFMADLEDRILSNYHLKPTFYTRYIDDIFLIWEDGLDSLKQFETYINNIHPSIKFTLEMSRTEIPFLDITTMLHNGDLSTTIYSKPTDNHKYLDYFSFHPMNLKRSIVYSQVLRLKRICSEPTDYATRVSSLASQFIKCRYPLSVIKSAITKASHRPRTDLLKYNAKSHSDRIPLILDYSPRTRPLTNAIKTDFETLKKDPSIKAAFQNPPIIARRQPPNLKSLLTSTQLPTTGNTPKKGNMPCGKARCQLCNIINTKQTFKVPGTNFIIHPPNDDCCAHNVLYLIYCTKCNNGNYVGETGTTFRSRFNNHKTTIRNKDSNHTVSLHFNSLDHDINDMRFLIISSNFKSTKDRRCEETKWIHRLKTHINGLNKDRGIVHDYAFANSST
ncbi:uncharacterized protein LOC117106549 [Anneissia japonica]|uniref:uncharacterized protein LOC117106549 n=1 Tax=Anneissia japonica TaxID=1529436 RepID=UPI00142598BF|nr:uncharacterized protein LOC117106549 [Anneissia japonica]